MVQSPTSRFVGAHRQWLFSPRCSVVRPCELLRVLTGAGDNGRILLEERLTALATSNHIVRYGPLIGSCRIVLHKASN
jgi:hypothetical protein